MLPLKPSKETAWWLLGFVMLLGIVIMRNWKASILVLLIVAAGAVWIIRG